MLFRTLAITAVLATAVAGVPTVRPRNVTAVAAPKPWDEEVRNMEGWDSRPVQNSIKCTAKYGGLKDIRWEVQGTGKWGRALGGRAFYNALRWHCGDPVGFEVVKESPDYLRLPYKFVFDLPPGNKDYHDNARPTCVADAFMGLSYYCDGLTQIYIMEGDCHISLFQVQSKVQVEDRLIEQFHHSRGFEQYVIPTNKEVFVMNPGESAKNNTADAAAVTGNATATDGIGAVETAVASSSTTRRWFLPTGVNLTVEHDEEDKLKLNAPMITYEDIMLPYDSAQGVVCIKDEKLLTLNRWTVLVWGPWVSVDSGKGFLDNLRGDCGTQVMMVSDWQFSYDFKPGRPYPVGRAHFVLGFPFLGSAFPLAGVLQSGECIKSAAFKASCAYGPIFEKCGTAGFLPGPGPIAQPPKRQT
jgi:hypothetical protein